MKSPIRIKSNIMNIYIIVPNTKFDIINYLKTKFNISKKCEWEYYISMSTCERNLNYLKIYLFLPKKIDILSNKLTDDAFLCSPYVVPLNSKSFALFNIINCCNNPIKYFTNLPNNILNKHKFSLVINNDTLVIDEDDSVLKPDNLVKSLTLSNINTFNKCTKLLLKEISKPKKEQNRKQINHFRASIKRFYKGYDLTSEQQNILEWCSGKGYKNNTWND